jgi:hypothetical protein
MVVGAAGTQRADGSIDATELRAGQAGMRGLGVPHDVTKPDASASPDASAGTGG